MRTLNRSSLPVLSLSLALTLFDAAWAWQALRAGGPHVVSNVALVSLVVWSYLHLPAAIVANGLAQAFGWLPAEAADLPDSALWLTGALGLAQTFALSYFLLRWWSRRRPA